MNTDWKKTLGAIAPALATALGGPVAGAAIAVLAKEFLGNEKATESDIAAAITSASPESLLKLREIDAKFKTDMAKTGVDLEKIAAADRDSARGLAKSKGTTAQIVISVVYNLGYFCILYAFIGSLLEDGMGDWQKGVIGTLVGILTAAIPQINNFWFGSTAGSKEKTALLVSK